MAWDWGKRYRDLLLSPFQPNRDDWKAFQSCFFSCFSTFDDVIVEERNEFFDSAHSAVEIRYEEGRGRFAIASKARFYNVGSIGQYGLGSKTKDDTWLTNCQFSQVFRPIKTSHHCFD